MPEILLAFILDQPLCPCPKEDWEFEPYRTSPYLWGITIYCPKCRASRKISMDDIEFGVEFRKNKTGQEIVKFNPESVVHSEEFTKDDRNWLRSIKIKVE